MPKREKLKFKKTKGFFNDFKTFATKGNIMDLAIAVVIGGAFGKIVTSLVNDLIMPIITLLVGGASVADWKWVITPAAYDAEGIQTVAENALKYGNFLQTIIDFLVIAFFIFLALRVLMRVKGGLTKIGSELSEMTKKEFKAEVKRLKAEGKNYTEIMKIMDEKEQERLEKIKAEEEAKKAEEEANRPETSEELLTQIRDLLAKQNSTKTEETE